MLKQKRYDDRREEASLVKIRCVVERITYQNPENGKNQIRIAYVLSVPQMEKALDILEEGLKTYCSLKGFKQE